MQTKCLLFTTFKQMHFLNRTPVVSTLSFCTMEKWSVQQRETDLSSSFQRRWEWGKSKTRFNEKLELSDRRETL